MIIVRTPFRISFFGGGTDYPAWSCQHGGGVLATTVDKYYYVTCRWLPPFFDHRYRITHSKVEDVKEVNDITQPAIKAVLNHYESISDGQGVEIHCVADLPSRSGLGSSSTLLVGLLHVMEALLGRLASQSWLAQQAIYFEQQILKENVGSQEQVASAFGGLNFIEFSKEGHFKVEPLPINSERRKSLNNNLLLFFTGFSREAAQSAKSLVDNIDSRNVKLHRIRSMVDDAVEILISGKDLRLFGELMHEYWLLKRSLSDMVSSPDIDKIYETARLNGAVGGKLLGAGGGGFILFYVEPERQHDVCRALSNLIRVPFRFENEGSRIIYYRE
jgi:D-glycero-alpha-D-manno-heptose-7-phosphate kinase